MREIKFRAWSLFNGLPQMIEWDRLLWLEALPNILDGQAEAEVMQYTGLKDKNGTDIYEADILSCKDYSLSDEDLQILIEYENGLYFGRVINGPILVKGSNGKGKITENTTITVGGGPHWDSKTKDMEIIGNCYEHPHLLEKGDK